MVQRTKFPQNIHLFDNRGNIRGLFDYFVFLSVLIFKHKNQTNRSSVIARLIEYVMVQIFLVSMFLNQFKFFELA